MTQRERNRFAGPPQAASCGKISAARPRKLSSRAGLSTVSSGLISTTNVSGRGEVRGKHCRRIDQSGGADDQHHVGATRRGDGRFPRCGRQRLAEPDDIGAKESAALVLDRVERQTPRAGGERRTPCSALRAGCREVRARFFEPARRCSESTFCVTSVKSRGRFEFRERDVSGVRLRRAACAARRSLYQVQTSRGSRAKPSGDASSSTRCVCQRPPAPRNVGRPLSLEMPEPVRTQMAPARASRSRSLSRDALGPQ